MRSKKIKDLNFKPEILKLLEESKGSTLQDTDVGTEFLTRAPVAQELR